jgi:hypothetical protein
MSIPETSQNNPGPVPPDADSRLSVLYQTVIQVIRDLDSQQAPTSCKSDERNNYSLRLDSCTDRQIPATVSPQEKHNVSY